MGRLLADSRYAHLTAKVKGSDGLRVYKRNRMIITNPVVSRKDPTFNTITYDWAPPGLTQKLVSLLLLLLLLFIEPTTVGLQAWFPNSCTALLHPHECG